MERQSPPLETPTMASSASTDPLYNNYCQSQSRSSAPWVTRALPPPTPRSPAAVPTLGVAGEYGAAPSGPSSWRGLTRHCWDPVGRGREGNGGGSPQEGLGNNDNNSYTYESILSIYDNNDVARIPAADELAMDGSDIVAESGEDVLRAAEDGSRSAGNSEDGLGCSWSSCEIVLAEVFASNGLDCSPFTPAQCDPETPRVPPPPPVRHCFRAPLTSGQCVFAQTMADIHATLPPLPSLAHAPNPFHATLAFNQSAAHAPLPSAQSSSTLRADLASLQQQINRQKEHYEAQIRRLEERNEALEVEVSSLRANLQQQRRWYQVVEIKMADAERARGKAECCNGELQCEMEMFFDMFGELNNEATKTERIVQSF